MDACGHQLPAPGGAGPGTPVFTTRRQAAGFTLIELMITLTILGILTAIALPTMQSTVWNSRVKAVVSDLHLSMMLARSEAIKRAHDATLTETTGGWDVKVWDLGTKSMVVLQSYTTNPNITLKCNITGDANADDCMDEVVFDRSGRSSCVLPSDPTKSCSTIELRFYYAPNNNVQMRCVELSLSGRPSVLLDHDGDTTNGCQ